MEKRNIVINIQATFDSDLLNDELYHRIREVIKAELPKIEGANPVGDYLITIISGPLNNFPRSLLD